MKETKEEIITVKESTMNAMYDTFLKLNAIADSMNLVACEKNEGNPEADKVELLQLSMVASDYMEKLNSLFDQAWCDNMKAVNDHGKTSDAERIKAAEA